MDQRFLSHRLVGRTVGVMAACAAVGLVAGTQGVGPAHAANYRNGTYSATGHYQRPGGEEQLGVTVTLADSIVKSVSIDTSHAVGASVGFQGRFKSGVGAQVVGKRIDQLNVHKVAGSSLSSNGFNDAIAQIKSQAAR